MAAEFPETHLSVLHALQSEDPYARERSFERLVVAYYKPIYMHLRLKWRKDPTQAEDLAQDFFVKVTERDTLASFDQKRGRFRTFVRKCVDNFVLTAREASQRQKRGGSFRLVSTDTQEAERALSAMGDEVDVESVFDREFVRNVMEKSVKRLEQRMEALGKPLYFEVLRRYDLDDGPTDPSYASVAKDLGIRTTDVTNYLHAARRELRVLVLDVLREVTSTEEEFREEAAELGIET